MFRMMYFQICKRVCADAQFLVFRGPSLKLAETVPPNVARDIKSSGCIDCTCAGFTYCLHTLCSVASKMSWMMRNLSNNMDFANTDALKNVCLQQTSSSLLTSCSTIHCKWVCLCWWSIWMFQRLLTLSTSALTEHGVSQHLSLILQ